MIVLMSSYASGGLLTATSATIGVIVAFIVLVLPQIGLGAYLIWHSLQETAVSPGTIQSVSPSENPPITTE